MPTAHVPDLAAALERHVQVPAGDIGERNVFRPGARPRPISHSNGPSVAVRWRPTTIRCEVPLCQSWGCTRRLRSGRRQRQRRRPAVFSNSGLSLERPGIGNAKRVDPLLIGRVYPGAW